MSLKTGRGMAVSFNTIDLNLLRVFDAVMEERSVLRASQKVCLSQSAVSHSLARLREMLEDSVVLSSREPHLVRFSHAVLNAGNPDQICLASRGIHPPKRSSQISHYWFWSSRS
jgi:Bacterial regulatory helix-turn-helix protein, lysR family